MPQYSSAYPIFQEARWPLFSDCTRSCSPTRVFAANRVFPCLSPPAARPPLGPTHAGSSPSSFRLQNSIPPWVTGCRVPSKHLTEAQRRSSSFRFQHPVRLRKNLDGLGEQFQGPRDGTRDHTNPGISKSVGSNVPTLMFSYDPSIPAPPPPERGYRTPIFNNNHIRCRHFCSLQRW